MLDPKLPSCTAIPKCSRSPPGPEAPRRTALQKRPCLPVRMAWGTGRISEIEQFLSSTDPLFRHYVGECKEAITQRQKSPKDLWRCHLSFLEDPTLLNPYRLEASVHRFTGSRAAWDPRLSRSSRMLFTGVRTYVTWKIPGNAPLTEAIQVRGKANAMRNAQLTRFCIPLFQGAGEVPRSLSTTQFGPQAPKKPTWRKTEKTSIPEAGLDKNKSVRLHARIPKASHQKESPFELADEG